MSSSLLAPEPASVEKNTTSASSNIRDRKPKVSIGLPVYNGENYLREALDSLLGQTFRDFELIISDNASTDATREIILQYQQRDSRIRYIRQESNIGASKNFLFVLAVSETELFMWASHDDIWAPNWLEVLLSNLTPDDIGVRGRLRFLHQGSIVATMTLPNFGARQFARCFLGNENNYRNHYAYSLFFREKLLAADLSSIHTDYCPDYLFIYCLLDKGALRCVSGTEIIYRVHSQNLGNEYSRPWKGWRKIIYRIHPLRYYRHYLHYTKDAHTRLLIIALLPLKHFYAQTTFWCRGFLEIITGRKVF